MKTINIFLQVTTRRVEYSSPPMQLGENRASPQKTTTPKRVERLPVNKEQRLSNGEAIKLIKRSASNRPQDIKPFKHEVSNRP